MRRKIIAGLLLGCGIATSSWAADHLLHTEYRYHYRSNKPKPVIADTPEEIYKARKALEGSRYATARDQCGRYEKNNKAFCQKEKESEHMRAVRELENDYKAGKLVPTPRDANTN